jgi:hypothetical protein
MTPLGMTHIGFSSEDLERADDSARPYVMADDEPGVFVRRRAPLWPIRDTPPRVVYVHDELGQGGPATAPPPLTIRSLLDPPLEGTYNH